MKYTGPKSIFLLLAVLLGSAILPVQAQSSLRKANQYFDGFKYALAIEEYTKTIKQTTPSLHVTQRLADAYRLNNQSVAAENWYTATLKFAEAAPVNIWYYAQMLHTNGKYEEAKVQYLQYAAKVPVAAPQARKFAEACAQAQQWLKRPPLTQVAAVAALNSSQADFSPIRYQNGILFTSDRSIAGSDATKSEKEDIYGWTGRPYLKLFTSAKSNGDWAVPTPLNTPLNTSFHNGTAALTNDEKRIYFTRTNLVKIKNKNANSDPTSWVESSLTHDFVNRLEIYSAENQNGQWTNIKPFAYNKVEAYSVGHPMVAPGGDLLYFISDMPGGFGLTDIYYCERMGDGSWGKPVNAGNMVNTSGREMFPAFDAEGTLYFSSDGHPGFGGLDLFSAKGARATWTGITNLMTPMNSSRNDYSIMVDNTGRAGLFSSDRYSEEATADLYEFSPVQHAAILAVTTVQRLTGQTGKNNAVPLNDVRLKLTLPISQDSLVAMTDAKGQFNFKVSRGAQYPLVGTKTGFLTQVATVIVPETAGDTVKVTLVYDYIQTNMAITLENIYFDLNKWNIRPDAALELDKLAVTLLANPKVKIEMGAHCDSREGNGYNQLLSELRAEATVNYLLSKGIARNRLIARGYGETQPVNDCIDEVPCSEEEHQLNRRTTFKIQKEVAMH